MSIYRHKNGDVKLSGDHPGAGVIISPTTWERIQAMPRPGHSGAALPMGRADRIYLGAKPVREIGEVVAMSATVKVLAIETIRARLHALDCNWARTYQEKYETRAPRANYPMQEIEVERRLVGTQHYPCCRHCGGPAA